MDKEAFIRRIEARAEEMKTSIRAVSIKATGRTDTIRNWQRKLAAGEEFSMRQDNIDAVAKALNVSTSWLMNGPGGALLLASNGLAEESAPYVAKASQSESVKVLFSDTARRAEIARRMINDLPGLGLDAGDLVVCDLGRDAAPGDLVLVHVQDDTLYGSTLIRLWATPWLLTMDRSATRLDMRDDQTGVTVRYPVIGSIRGA